MIGVGTAIIYLAALLCFPLITIYDRPLQNLDKLTHSTSASGFLLGTCILLLFGGYALGALILERAPHAPTATRRWLAIMLGCTAVFLITLLLIYPLTSIDLYDYLFRGRMLVRYRANTFIQTPQTFDKDPLYFFVAWKRAVTAYGPLWESMGWITTWLAGERPGAPIPGTTQHPELLRLMLAYKSLGIVGFLLCGAAIWGALGTIAPAQRLLGSYLWFWNPLALWESVAAGHNDAWMALLIVIAVWALSDRRTPARTEDTEPSPTSALIHRALGAFLALTLGGLIKFLALFLGPTVLVAALRRIRDTRSRITLIIGGGLACTTLVMFAYAPFWAGWQTLRNFGDRGTLFTASWLATLQAFLRQITTKETSQTIAASLGVALLACGMLWAAWRAWRRPYDLAHHTLWLLLWFLFLCNPWFQPWYLLWALALVALQPWHTRAVWGIGLFCCTAMFSYIAGSFLLPLLGWASESAAWNALISALLYLPPLLIFGWRTPLRLLKRTHSNPVLVAQRDSDSRARYL